MEKEIIAMSRCERDVLKVMSLVLECKRTQEEAGRLLSLSVRQVRRVQRRLESKGDIGVAHRLRGKPSNARLASSVRTKALGMYRRELSGFHPRHAWEKLTEAGLELSARTLHLWLVAEGLWKPVRKVEKHRRRRERKACFGEMVQADASVHDWLEGRGPRMELVGVIDDATGRIFVRFYEGETTGAYMDLPSRYIQKFGRPLIWYSDRAGIFRAEEKVSGHDGKQSVPTSATRRPAESAMTTRSGSTITCTNCIHRSCRASAAAKRSWSNDLMDRRTFASNGNICNTPKSKPFRQVRQPRRQRTNLTPRRRYRRLRPQTPGV